MLKYINGSDGNYLIGTDGNIWSKRNSRHKWKKLKQQINPTGYYTNNIKLFNSYKRISSHRLLVQTFIGPINNGEVVNHIDGNKLNNDIHNLEIVTSKDNSIHSIRLLARNIHNRQRKIPEGIVHERLTREEISLISETYNCTKSAVYSRR